MSEQYGKIKDGLVLYLSEDLYFTKLLKSDIFKTFITDHADEFVAQTVDKLLSEKGTFKEYLGSTGALFGALFMEWNEANIQLGKESAVDMKAFQEAFKKLSQQSFV